VDPGIRCLATKAVNSAIPMRINDGDCASCAPLSFEFAVLFQELPVWIDLEARLFSVRSDDNFIVSFAIRVIYPFYSRRLLLNCGLDRSGERL
jgi:hypothetical protein